MVYCTDGLDVPCSDCTIRWGAADRGACVPQVWKVGWNTLQIGQAHHPPCQTTDMISSTPRMDDENRWGHYWMSNCQTCVSSEAFALVTSGTSCSHLGIEVAASQEVSLPGECPRFSPHCGKVAETPAPQTQPPGGQTWFLMFTSFFLCHLLQCVKQL